MILSFVAVYDLEMHQLDIKTAFLYGELDEEIYLEQLEGVIKKGQKHMVCTVMRVSFFSRQIAIYVLILI